jgi:hypothetical protein
MATKIAKQIPSVKNWGGVRSIQRRLERSATIMENREAVAYALLCMANTKITDIMKWQEDEDGKLQVKVKPASEIPDHALQSIKSIKINKQGELEVELYDKVGVLRLLAKASGLLDSPESESDKPSVIGINIKAPDIQDVEVDNHKGEKDD